MNIYLDGFDKDALRKIYRSATFDDLPPLDFFPTGYFDLCHENVPQQVIEWLGFVKFIDFFDKLPIGFDKGINGGSDIVVVPVDKQRGFPFNFSLEFARPLNNFTAFAIVKFLKGHFNNERK